MKIVKSSSGISTGNYSCQTLTIPATPSYVVQAATMSGWILMQQNLCDGSQNFKRHWIEFRNGFDDSHGNFWVGNEKLHQLTSSARWKLRIEIQAADTKIWYYAEYSSFTLNSESDSYRIRVSGYSGTAGDAFRNNFQVDWITNGYRFSTFDSDQSPGSCPGNGWWWNSCGLSQLNDCKWGTLEYRYHVSLQYPTQEWLWLISGSRMMIMNL